MNQFLQMDIFFFITTLAVVAVAVLMCVGLYYLIRILRNVKHISEEVEGETVALRGDIDEARRSVRSEGFKLKHLVTLARKSGERLFKRTRT